jgi:hypothetical protein
LSLLTFNGFSQVGIGTTNPNPNALLDIDATNTPGGLLLPRVGLTGTNSFAPLTANIEGMVIYNTATAGVAPNNVTPGYYYNDGSQWVRIAAASLPSNDWTITGNTGTNTGTNFLGTINDVGLRFRTNSLSRFEITNGTTQANGGRLRAFTNGDAATPIYSWNANVGTGMFQQAANVIGFSTNTTERFRIPNANQVHAIADGTAALPFYSWASDTDIGMYRNGANTLAFSTAATERIRLLANGQVIVNNTAAPVAGDRFTVQGADTERAINGNTTSGTGVYGNNGSGVGNGVFGNSTNVGVRGFGAHGAILESGFDGGFGTIAWNTATSGVNRAGLLVLGQNLTPIYFDDTAAILYGTAFGGAAFTNDATGTGFMSTGNALSTATSLTNGSGFAASGTDIGVFGYASSSANLPNITIGKAGGYFANAEGGFAYVAAWYDPPGGGNTADVNYKIIGTGTVSTIVKDVNETPITMFAPEAPEILFQDYGIGKLNNGTAIVRLDPNLSKNIRVDDNHPLKVFVQLEGDCNGVYVTNKSANEFTVKELQGGRSNVSFSWSIVATRADEIFYNDKGEARVSHNNQRFPLAPKPMEITKTKVTKSSAGAVTNKVVGNAQFTPNRNPGTNQEPTTIIDKVESNTLNNKTKN